MSHKAHGNLIRKIRGFIKHHKGGYSQVDLFRDAAKHGNINDPKTIQNAEKGRGLHSTTFVDLAKALSEKLKEIRQDHPDSELLDLLKNPGFAWILHRLLEEIEPTLEPEHLIMNHESRYLVEEYKGSLTVFPIQGGMTQIERSGQKPEAFSYDNLAISRSKITFSEHNQKFEPGFKLRYATTDGRIELREPEVNQLIDPPDYRLHKRAAAYHPDPSKSRIHDFEVRIFGGYGEGNETTHYSLAQQAIYQNVIFSVDLTAYPEDAFIKQPELIMVPVIAGRPFDCCEIARSGQGLKVEPSESYGLNYKWKFQDLMNVMLCVQWETKR